MAAFKLCKLFSHRLGLILIILAGICYGTDSFGKRAPHPYSISHKDSIVLEESSRLFSAAVNIDNITNANLEVYARVKYPNGWRPISRENLFKVALTPHQRKAITVTMLQSQGTRAGFDSVCLQVWDNRHSDTDYYAIKFIVRPRLDYLISPIDQKQFMTDSMPKTAVVKLRIKNTGNVEDVYVVSCENDFFKINSKLSIPLKPGEDTLVTLSAPFTRKKWSQLNTEDIFVRYNGVKGGKENTAYYQISRPVSQVKQEVNPGKIMPLTLGGGILSFGENLSYFGSIETHLSLGDHQFSFSYRSKQFGNQAQSYQPNVFNFSYIYKGLNVEAGQITGLKNFYTNGQGLAVSYKARTGLFVNISGLKYQDIPVDVRYKNENIFGRIEYPLKKLRISHRFESNFNTFLNIKSYLLENEISIIRTKKSDLAVYVGGGYDDGLKNQAGLNEIKYGYAGGYTFVYYTPKINFTSTVDYHSPNFPGNFKGQQIQRHELIYNIKKVGFGLTYVSNTGTQSALLDTVYRSDYLINNNTKYGVLLVKNGLRFTGTLRAGVVHQDGLVIGFPDGQFADISAIWKLNTHKTFSATINNAFQMADDGNINYATNAYMNYYSKTIGFSATYNRFPIFSTDKQLVAFSETVNAGPSVNFGVFRQTLTGNIRISVAKTLNEETLRPGIGGQIMYRSRKGGIDFGANGYYPLHDPAHTELPLQETRYGSVYLNKRINFQLNKARLHKLTVTLFEDANHNGQREGSEKVLKNTLILIDNHSLVTDANGTAKYERIKPGIYQIDLANATSNGQLPVNGLVQSVEVLENTDVDIPFEMGNLLKGNVKIDLDTLSTLKLTPEGFKVTISDTSGKYYHALTDYAGNFEVYLPKGIYTVSLNPAAFLTNDFKPVSMSYTVDLLEKKVSKVQFVIRQKKRTIRYLDINKNAPK